MQDAKPRETDKVDVHIGCRLRYFRQQRNLSLQDTAKALGWTYQQLQKYESGANRISCSRLVKIVHFYNIGVLDIYDGLPGLPSNEGSEGQPCGIALQRIEPRARSHLMQLIDVLSKTESE